MDQISILCPHHQENIEFLDFNKNVPLDLRALCKKCKLINPINIEEALNLFNEYKAQYVKDIEFQLRQVWFPMKEIKSSLKRVRRNMISNLDNALYLIKFLIEPTVQYKNQKIQELDGLGKERTLSSLQKTAQILCEKEKVNLQEFMQKMKVEGPLLQIETIIRKIDSISSKQYSQLQNIEYKIIDNVYDAYVKEGDDLKNMQKYDEALMFYDKAIDINHFESSAYNNKDQDNAYQGLSQRNLKNLKKLSNVMIKLSKRTLNAVKHLIIKEMYQKLLKNMMKLTNVMTKLSGLPHKIVQHIEIKELHYENKKYDEAVRIYDQAIKISPQSWAAFYNKGNALRQLEKYDDAIKCYDEAIRINPQHFYAFFRKGIALYELKQYDEAVKSYEEAIRIDPSDSDVLYNNGNALRKLEKHDEAIKFYDEAIRIDPQDSSPFYNKGIALKELKKFDEAVKCFDEAIKINPQHRNAILNKGFALNKLKKFDEVIECYDLAIKIDPSNSDIFYNKGNALDELKKYNEAVECYDEAIRINPKDGDFFNNKGFVLETMGRLNEALVHYEQAISLNSNYFLYFESKGDVLVKLGRLNEAIQNYQESINKGNPNPLEINNKIASIQK